MMTAEHRKPLVAFFLVFAAACLIMGNGMRTQVVEVLIRAGAPRELITAVSPDMVLGESLTSAPTSQAVREVPATVKGPVQADKDDVKASGSPSPIQSAIESAVESPDSVVVSSRAAGPPRRTARPLCTVFSRHAVDGSGRSYTGTGAGAMVRHEHRAPAGGSCSSSPALPLIRAVNRPADPGAPGVLDAQAPRPLIKRPRKPDIVRTQQFDGGPQRVDREPSAAAAKESAKQTDRSRAAAHQHGEPRRLPLAAPALALTQDHGRHRRRAGGREAVQGDQAGHRQAAHARVGSGQAGQGAEAATRLQAGQGAKPRPRRRSADVPGAARRRPRR